MAQTRLNRSRSRQAVMVGAVLVVAGSLAAGCSSGPGSGSAPGASGSAAQSVDAAPSGSTVPVMVEEIGPAAPAALEADNPPDVVTVLQAAAAYVNAHGGAGGHRIQVDTCYDQGDPNLSASCARQAIANHDVAVVAPLILTSDDVLPVLAPAHIPFFGAFPVSPDDFSSPDSFPLTAGGVGEEAGVGYILSREGCKKMGILYTAEPVTEATVPDVAASAEANGAQVVAKVSLPMTAVDARPQIAEIDNAGADCLALALQQNQIPGAVIAARQGGQSLMIGSPSGGFPSSVLKTLGSIGNGVYLAGSASLPGDTGNPAVAQMLAVAKQYEGSSTQPEDSFSSVAWADAQLLFNDVIGKTTGAVSGQSVTAGIEALKAATTGVVGPYTGSAAPALSTYPRVINYGLTFWKIENGNPEPTQSGFTNIASSLRALSK